jgi:ketosteroid isomerase-like protein
MPKQDTTMTNGQALSDLAQQLETQRWQLLLDADAQALSDLMSDDLHFVHSSGLKDDKKQYIDAIETGTVIYRSADSRIEAVVPLGDRAFIAHGVVKMEAIVRGTERRLHSIFMVAWRREQDAWRLVAHQTTLLPA